jgi:hypothetical protein
VTLALALIAAASALVEPVGLLAKRIRARRMRNRAAAKKLERELDETKPHRRVKP